MSLKEQLDKPPTRGNMGPIQIIELVIMGVVAILCAYDFFYIIDLDYWNFFTVLALFVDVVIIVGVIFICLGLFAASGSSRRIQIGIYCFFAGTIVEVVLIVYFLIEFSGKLSTWLLYLLKAIILCVLAWLLWRQSKNV